MKTALPALRILIALTVLTGVLYPLAVTGIGQLVFPHQANGSMIHKEGQLVGSRLIAQKATADRYFWPRPSAVDYNPLPSGASNLGPTSKKLKEDVDARREAIAKSGGGEVPADLLFNSASGLDPHVSPAAALFQVDRVAQARQLTAEQKAKLVDLVKQKTEGRQFGFLGEERVNVLDLNLALDDQLK